MSMLWHRSYWTDTEMYKELKYLAEAMIDALHNLLENSQSYFLTDKDPKAGPKAIKGDIDEGILPLILGEPPPSIADGLGVWNQCLQKVKVQLDREVKIMTRTTRVSSNFNKVQELFCHGSEPSF